MRYKDFNFRIYNPNVGYLDSPVYYFYQNKAERDPNCEIEIWTGLFNRKGVAIYEGDIVAHCVKGGGIEYHSEVVFDQDKGVFEFVCIEHPITATFDKLKNSDILVVGNIHESDEKCNFAM